MEEAARAPRQRRCFWRMWLSRQDSMYRVSLSTDRSVWARHHSFYRISRERSGRNLNIYHPDFVNVVDETLLHSVHVTDGLKREGAVIVNTPRTAEEIRPLLQGYSGAVYTVDARAISEETLGRNFPNTPMLAAAVAVSGVMEKEDFLREMRASFLHKFARKPEVVNGNMKALEMACEVIEKTAGMNRSA